ncbi:zinc ribbon domain-containing protein [Streptomyces platensis]|uniref:zinc ribbon domain-containing protein n=1 Tax=Streptomyces platensis TaxID=58346 RepID=UPI00379E0871
MTTDAKSTEDPAHCRYTFRLRLSSTARHALEAEWDRCRWIWNECVAKSKAVHLHNKAHPEDKQTCGPVQLAKMLTEARAVTPWLLAKSTMARKAADATIGATTAALVEMGRKHGRDVRLVHPAHTTMDCAKCGARTKHALPLSERTYACIACGAVSPRDKNSARVMSPSYRWEVPPGPGWSSTRLTLIV